MSTEPTNHPAVHLLSEQSDPRTTKLVGMIEIDPQFKHVKQNEKVRHYLEDLQTYYLTADIKIGPQEMFYIFTFLFMLPSLWSVVSVAIIQFSPKLFFDGCENRVNTSNTYTAYDCFICCNNRSFVYTDLIQVPQEARIGQIVTIVVSVLVALASGPSYSKLQLAEHLAIHLLSYGVVVKTEFDCKQFYPVVLFTFLFAAISGLYLWTQSLLTSSYNNSILGFGDVCDSSTPFAGQVLYAKFSDSNPSLSAGSLPRNEMDYFTGFLTVFLPFVPIIIKMLNAARTTYSKLGLEHLVRGAEDAQQTLQLLQFEVEEKALMKAIESYAKLLESEETCGRTMRRFIVCNWDRGTPIPEYFGWRNAWGYDDKDIQCVLTFLEQEKSLQRYRPQESMKKKVEILGKKNLGKKVNPEEGGQPQPAVVTSGATPAPQQQQQPPPPPPVTNTAPAPAPNIDDVLSPTTSAANAPAVVVEEPNKLVDPEPAPPPKQAEIKEEELDDLL